MTRRPWTPDQIILDPQGERMIAASPKRGCSHCHTVLGDLTDTEMAIVTLRRRLPPVHGECPLCLGFHAVLVEPAAPAEPGSETAATSTRLLCPGTPTGVTVAPCASWDTCGCAPDPSIDVPSTEWVAFLAEPCPTSATGEHRHLADRDDDAGPYVGHPVPGTCRYQETILRLAYDARSAYLAGLVREFAAAPGLYPVEIEEFDRDTLVFQPLDIAPHRPAEVAAL